MDKWKRGYWVHEWKMVFWWMNGGGGWLMDEWRWWVVNG